MRLQAGAALERRRGKQEEEEESWRSTSVHSRVVKLYRLPAINSASEKEEKLGCRLG
jgi:hypothetical protein